MALRRRVAFRENLDVVDLIARQVQGLEQFGRLAAHLHVDRENLLAGLVAERPGLAVGLCRRLAGDLGLLDVALLRVSALGGARIRDEVLRSGHQRINELILSAQERSVVMYTI
ncbi:hypothetical protein [Burkholderia sp. JP2-270]|uniref:hypothetical protein n=1 Tax=Burkholderia sp. JP2-270 TaxID=2217913 RepID=UPI0013A6C264|nr:hypothetical protein [Burkholderia sp. JP2-270]